MRPGISSPQLPLPFPLGSTAAFPPGPPAPSPAFPLSLARGERKGAILTPAPSFPAYLVKSPLVCHFCRNTPSLLFIQGTSLHHIHLILNRPLHLSSMPQIFLEITTKSFSIPKLFTNEPMDPCLTLNPSSAYHFMRQTISDRSETLPRHSYYSFGHAIRKPSRDITPIFIS